MNSILRTVVFWAVIVISAILLWQVARTRTSVPREPEISYSEFMSKVADGQVSKVTIAGNEVRGRDVKGIGFHVVAPPNQGPMLETLQKRGVEIWFRKEAAQDWPTWVMNLAPLIMLAALWFFMIRQMQLRSKRSTSGQPTSTDPQMNPRFGP